MAATENCNQKRVCKVCNQNHPTSLHVFKVNAIADQCNEDGSGMCVVVVRLSHSLQPGVELLVYAMLDECSQGCFINEDILMEFSDIRKEETSCSTNTLHGDETAPSLKSTGFVVKCSESHEIEHNTYEGIELPEVYSRFGIPLDKSDIPSEQFIAKWDYLDQVSRAYCKEDGIRVGLIIGRNCKKALEPIQVIPSRGDGPYAYRTHLGWVVGSSTLQSSKKLSVNKVKVSIDNGRWPAKDVSTGLPSKICFGIENCVKEQGVESPLKEVWNADTVEPDSERISLSTEDRRFLQIMKNNIKLIDGRYEVPMPFRDEHPSMPNNRGYAIKRAESVKRKLLTDDSHRAEYVQFMSKVIDSGYARIAQPLKPGESFWILPHFAVYHPTKGKIRVVLDCSAKYKGVSLNCHLLQGPDLTNHMAGVFIRFREDQVPIIWDLEAMYCQVLVPEHQRRYIRFLWWPGGNLESELQEYEMCVHVFGAISSMGCVNYALRQAAADWEIWCGSSRNIKERLLC